jgi:uncharacterized RDD family membrane protein YckC
MDFHPGWLCLDIRGGLPAMSKPVGVARRFFAFAVDDMVLFVPIGFVTGLYVATLDDGQEISSALLTLYVIGLGFAMLLYFSLMEAYTGRTIGKRWLNIRVIKVDGSPMDLKSALIRNAMRIVDIAFNSGLVGALAIWISPNNQRLGDMAAKTLVIRDAPAEVTTEAAVPEPAV